MTQPAEHGYPDWGRFQATADVELANIVDDELNTVGTYGTFFCGGFKYIAITMEPAAASAQYGLIWSLNQDGSGVVGSDGAVMPANSDNTLVFPVLGTWLTILVSLASGPNTHSMRVYTVPNATSLTDVDAEGTVLFATGFFNQGAASNQTLTTTKVFAGEAFVFTRIGATSGQIQIRAVDVAGTAQVLSLHSTITGPDPQQLRYMIMLPAKPIQVFVQNNDGVAREFAVTIIGRPLHGGR